MSEKSQINVKDSISMDCAISYVLRILSVFNTQANIGNNNRYSMRDNIKSLYSDNTCNLHSGM